MAERDQDHDRARWRRSKRKVRGLTWFARSRGSTTCQLRTSWANVCGGVLEDRVDRLGRATIVCPRCERRRAGICRDCPRRVRGVPGRATRCPSCSRRYQQECNTRNKRRAVDRQWHRRRAA